MAQKVGAFNFQRLVCDFRAILRKSRAIRRQSGRRKFRTLIAPKNASILAHFSRSDIGPELGPEIGNYYPRFGYSNRDPLIPNDRSDLRTTLGKSWPTHHPSGRPSFWALISAKDASFLAHYSRSDIGLEMHPKIGYH